MKEAKKRRNYYKQRTKRMVEIAEINTEKAMTSGEYRATMLKKYLLKQTIAQEDVWKDKAKADELREEYKICEAKELEILGSMGLSPQDLYPQHVCQKCRDTGYLVNGELCDCYPKEN